MTSYSFRRIGSYVFIVAIAVVFTLSFGPGSQGCEAPVVSEGENSAAMVNGTEIPMIEFRRQYRNIIASMRGQGLTESLARQLGYHKQVLEQLVNTELLAQAAARHGIAASDEELAELVHQNPDFQKDGRFDPKTYRDVLRQYYGKSEVDYERDLRRRLAAQKMIETVEATAAVSEDEVKSRFLKEANRAQLTFVRFVPSMFADQAKEPSPAEVSEFVKNHEKAIADYYESNKFAYSQPEQVRARHILLKVDEGATPEQKAQARQRLEELRRQIVEGGADFAELAKQHSEDEGSKPQGGDLGFNTSDAWVKPFSDAAFALKTGEVSQPVETQFGMHLIKVEEKKPPQNRPLEEVRSEIAAILVKREKAKEQARAEAQKALEQLKAGKSLTALYPVPKEDGPEEGQIRFTPPTKPQAVETTEFDAASETIPRLGAAPKMVTEIFNRQQPGPLDQVFEVGDAFVVGNVTARTLPSDGEFEEKKQQLQAEARRAKQFEIRESYLKALRAQGDVKTNEAAVEEALGPATTG